MRRLHSRPLLPPGLLLGVLLATLWATTSMAQDSGKLTDDKLTDDKLTDDKLDATPPATAPVGQQSTAAPPKHLQTDSRVPTRKLEVVPAAAAQLQQCQGHIGNGAMREAEACLVRLIDAHPRSVSAAKARTALVDVRSFQRLMASRIKPKTPDAFPDGRLEFVATMGAFGIYSATAPAMWLGTNTDVPLFFSAVGGGAAVLVGGGFALGSYLIADAFDLDAGQTKLLQSGAFWGLALGVAISPWVMSAVGTEWEVGQLLPPLDFERGLPAAILASAATGYVGLMASAGASLFLDLDASQVSMMNTGAGVGVLAGFGLAPFLGLLGVAGAGPTGLVTSATMAVGLVAGWGMSQLLKFDPWEILVIDGVTLLGGGVGLAAALVLSAGGDVQGAAFGGLALLLSTGSSLGLATAGMAFVRAQRGDEVSRVGLSDVEKLFAPPAAIYDKDGQLVPMMPLVSWRF